MTNVTRLPEPGVILNLDIEEKPEEDVKDPFVVTVTGKNITFADPSDVDWRDLASVNIPADLLRVSLSDDDLEHLRKQPLPTWKFNKLMKSYYDYYGLEQKIRDAKRQQQFANL